MEGGERDEPSRQKGGGKVKKGVIFFLLALSVLMIRSEYGDLPASLYGIFMGWTLGRARIPGQYAVEDERSSVELVRRFHGNLEPEYLVTNRGDLRTSSTLLLSSSTAYCPGIRALSFSSGTAVKEYSFFPLAAR